MSNGFNIPYEEYEPIGPGVFPAEVIDVEQDEGEFGEFLRIRFNLLETDDERSLVGIASAKFTTKSKLYKWTASLLNGDVDLMHESGFSPDLILGKTGQLIVEVDEKDGTLFDKITNVLPPNMKVAADAQPV